MRRICVFTGSRADYGPLRPLLQALERDDQIHLQILATGGHFVPEQGSTITQLLEDGFAPDELVEMVLAGDSATAVATSFGLGAIGYASALTRLDPDMLVILGDRYEALAAAAVAALRLLPVVHIAGGEVTHGSTDDFTRHAVSKLAHLHFTSNSDAQRRVIQMGESPNRVIATGSPGLDTVRTTELIDRAGLENDLGIRLRNPTVLVTYHPATADPPKSHAGATALLEALDHFPEASVVFTATNVDHGGPQIGTLIRDYAGRNPDRVSMHSSLGQQRYLSLLKQCDVVVGNSSSALIEAPALGTAAVNIGTRQDGRPRAESVIDCSEDVDSIVKAIQAALSAEHQERAAQATSPFGDGSSVQRMVEVLKAVDLAVLTRKKFHDLDCRERS